MRRRIQERLRLGPRLFLLERYSEEDGNEMDEGNCWIDGDEREERDGKDGCNDCIVVVKEIGLKETGGNDAMEGLREMRSDYPCWEVQIKPYTL